MKPRTLPNVCLHISACQPMKSILARPCLVDFTISFATRCNVTSNLIQPVHADRLIFSVGEIIPDCLFQDGNLTSTVFAYGHFPSPAATKINAHVFPCHTAAKAGEEKIQLAYGAASVCVAFVAAVVHMRPCGFFCGCITFSLFLLLPLVSIASSSWHSVLIFVLVRSVSYGVFCNLFSLSPLPRVVGFFFRAFATGFTICVPFQS